MIPYRNDPEGIMTALTIRKDRTPSVLRKLAKAEANARVARRLLAVANALSGMSRKEAAEAAGMDRQTLRDWVIRHNAHGVDGLCDCWGDGRPPRLEPEAAGRTDPHRFGWSQSQSRGRWRFGIYPRGSGPHLRNPLWQELPSGLDGTALKALRLLTAKGEAKPSPKRPGPGRGL